MKTSSPFLEDAKGQLRWDFRYLETDQLAKDSYRMLQELKKELTAIYKKATNA